ncbi:DNA-directed RNA polymerase subunit M [Sulfolobus acidocaldarius SUSAZ]|nr:DNA-directed RNA polymerase subunit M [Sulfolobus acidocaldarius SUSAZ]
MKFCPKCGSMMMPRRENGKTVYKCSKCGYIDTENQKEAKITTVIKHSAKEKTLVLESDMPKTGVQLTRGISCPSCGNDEAYFWILQTRSADEPATRFYKCTKCGKVWREYE